MMPWSAPSEQQGVTPAVAGMHVQLHSPDISGVLRSIMAERLGQQKQLQDAAGQAVKGIGGLMQQRRQDRVAQSLLDYESYDKPNEDGSFGDPVAAQLNESDMHPSDAYKALTDLRNNQLKNALTGAQTHRFDAMGDYYDNRPTGPTARPAKPAPPTYADKILSKQGLTPNDLSFDKDKMDLVDQNGNPVTDEDLGADPKLKPFIRGTTSTGKTFHLPREDFRAIYNTYGTGAPPPSPGAGVYGEKLQRGVTQEGVNEAADQMHAETPVGTKVRQNGTVYQWDGQNWNPAQ